ELRNEAIACLALPDLRLLHEWDGGSDSDRVADVDEKLERYVRLDGRGKVSVRRVSDNQLLYELASPEYAGAQAHLSPDGQFLSFISQRGGWVWRLEDAKAVPVLEDTKKVGYNSWFSGDSRQLAIGHPDASISFYDLRTGRLIRRLPPGPSFAQLAFHPLKPQVALAWQDSVQIRDLETGKEIGVPMKYPREPRPVVRWRPDGKALAACGGDHSIYIWEAATGKQIGKL